MKVALLAVLCAASKSVRSKTLHEKQEAATSGL
jgi:hypothetical protein